MSLIGSALSIAGFIHIFSASPILIGIMGACLEMGKLTVLGFLTTNWRKLNLLFRTHLILMVVALLCGSVIASLVFLSATYERSVRRLNEATTMLGLLRSEKARQEYGVNQAGRKDGLTYPEEENSFRRRQVDILNKKIAETDSIISAIAPQVHLVDQLSRAIGRRPDEAARLLYFALILALHPVALILILLGLRPSKKIDAK